MKQVARMAGVSAMTASRVLSGKDNVSERRRIAVIEAAKKLGYNPNPLLRRVMSDLRRGQSLAVVGSIAFLNASKEKSDWTNLPYLKPFMDGILEQAESTGFIVDNIWINQPNWSAQRTESVLKARGIQGILIVPGTAAEQVDFSMDEFAVASFGGLAFPLQVHQVLPDVFYNYSTCYQELWSMGYRKIGLYLPDYERQINRKESLGGYLSARCGTPEAEIVPIGGDNSKNWESSEDDFKKWVLDNQPDAIIANYNQLDRWIQEIGLNIPTDIGLAHSGLAHDVDGWSGIDPDLYSQGTNAVDLLTAQIFRNEKGLPDKPKRLTIAGKWINGKTTKPH